MAVVNQMDLIFGAANMSKKTSKVAAATLYGLSSCSATFGDLWMNFLIYDTLQCSGGQYLNQSQLDCLTGKFTDSLNANCC